MAAIPSGYIWQCDFETSSGASAFCNMEQSLQDTPNYDWQIWSGSTPSFHTGPTGPTFAYNGAYYLYFEASQPFENGNTARYLCENIRKVLLRHCCYYGDDINDVKNVLIFSVLLPSLEMT